MSQLSELVGVVAGDVGGDGSRQTQCERIVQAGWRSFDLFVVGYRRGEPLDLLAAPLSLAPQLALVALAGALLASRHWVYARSFVAGIVAYVLASIVKHTVDAERPENSLRAGDPGWPSAHSAAAAGMAVIVANERFPALVRLGAVAGALLVAWSRVQLLYHTVDQVAAGLCLGAGCGCVVDGICALVAANNSKRKQQ
eukprot:TRINITY_DN219_c0_g1_i1.p1 TRINITY_DN219_c0_g1~~TRINITY_DN219_c0_g1_i1.p1  ORF type:complete len:198 (+),score=75.59 TRINITY_DN219_c0_g1_i1:424-1017(+)